MDLLAKVILADCRRMREVVEGSIDLVVTSPPYWQIKDYGHDLQIGCNQSFHDYLKDLFLVWCECYRVMKPGSRLCVNVGDQFLRAFIYGRYRVAPIHAEIITQCEKIGFDYLGSIIWQKKTNTNPTGGEQVMGSFPYPTNGIVKIDYEFVLIFKKIGTKTVPPESLRASVLKREEWDTFFSGHWTFPGQSQTIHGAVFPEELPKRLVKMFSCVGDLILDPFLGSGTTAKAAIGLNRNFVGYELNPSFASLIKSKVESRNDQSVDLVFSERHLNLDIIHDPSYVPGIKDAMAVVQPSKLRFGRKNTYRVVEVVSADTLVLDTGLVAKFAGIEVIPGRVEEAKKFLESEVKGNYVVIVFDQDKLVGGNPATAKIYCEDTLLNEEMVAKGFCRKRDTLITRP